jgi:hypothetical protein
LSENLLSSKLLFYTKDGFMKEFVVFLTLSSLVVSDSFAAPQENHVPGEIIIHFKSKLKPQFLDSISQVKVSLARFELLSARVLSPDSQLLLLKIADDAKLQSAIAKIENQEDVDFAEPNYKLKLSSELSDDPLFIKNWNLNNVGQATESGKTGKWGADINVLPLWRQGVVGNRKIIVAVVDTGIDWNHEDLRQNIFTNAGERDELATNGKDDDNNGYIDDIHGWNFVANNNQSQDDNRHGTHCAGIIGAVGNNGIGIVGVNWQVSLLPIKFINRDGEGATSDAIEGMRYAGLMGAKIFSNSWGGGEYSKALRLSIERANADGILFVAAAGNSKSNNDYRASYPANYKLPNIVSVGASNNLDEKAYFSNYGRGNVHVMAPGQEIYSTLPNNQYGPLSGTSMAAPQVSGIAALILSVNPDLSPLSIRERLIRTSEPLYSLKAFVQAQGRINAFNAINNIVPAIDHPSESEWQDFPFALESTHPYERNANSSQELKIIGARKIRLVFAKVDFERGLDFLRLEDKNKIIVDEISGNHENYVSDFVEGDKIKIKMHTNATNQQYGFRISKAQYTIE